MPLFRCTHCGNFVGKTQKKFCEFCNLAKGRKEGCEENIRIFKENGLKVPYCNMCKI